MSSSSCATSTPSPWTSPLAPQSTDSNRGSVRRSTNLDERPDLPRLIGSIAAAVLLASGCGGSQDARTEMVWCVAPGEKVTPSFKREYPDLYMAKAACDLFTDTFK